MKQQGQTLISQDIETGYSYSFRNRRNKTDWAGISMGNAFNPNLDYYTRMPAQRLFYQFVNRVEILGY